MTLNNYCCDFMERPFQEALMKPTLAMAGDTIDHIDHIVAIYWHVRLFVSW